MDELESAVGTIDDVSSRNKIKLVVEGELMDMWGELVIGEGSSRETYFINGADSLFNALIEVARQMERTTK